MSTADDNFDDVLTTTAHRVLDTARNSNTHLPLFTFISLVITSIPTYYYSTVLRFFVSDNILTYAVTFPICMIILAYTYNTVYNIAYTSISNNTPVTNTKRNKTASASTGNTTVQESIAFSILVVNIAYIGAFTFANAYLTSAQQPQISYIASVLISAVLAFVIGRAVAQ